MKHLRKLTALLIALLIALSLLSGCDVIEYSEYETTTPETAYTEPEESEAPSTAEPDELPDDDDAEPEDEATPEPTAVSNVFSIEDIPEYSGSPYVNVNNGIPYFTEDEITDVSFEQYSDLDELGRCGVCFACVGTDIMPTEKRGDISSVKPTGWVQNKYDFVDGKSLYNRCHLIGFQLTGENDNELNLITGTRYMNVDGMLPFENYVADYVKEEEGHVMYRVTPIFEGNNLVASGVLMEASSVEDDGKEVQFCVFCYNVQPGVEIDYATGENKLAEDSSEEGSAEEYDYVLNTSSKKFHNPDCSSAQSVSEENREDYHGTREQLIEEGYTPCGKCNP